MRIPLLGAARAVAAVVAAFALVLLSVPFTANAANESFITVKVGGERTGAATNAVAGVAGVTFQAYTNQSSSANTGKEGTAIDNATCTTLATGSCTITIPNTVVGSRFWVKQVSANGGNSAVLSESTGDGTSFMSTPYIWRTPEMNPGSSVTLPDQADMPNNYGTNGSGNNYATANRWVKTNPVGPYPVTLKNPRYQATCTAPRIGILIDLSFSMSQNNNAGIDGAKAAANAMIDQLATTDALLGIYNFGTKAPKDGMSNHAPITVAGNVNTLKGYVNAYSAGGTANYTNWDRGLYQLVDQDLDVVIVLTDGNPTVFGNDPSAPSGTAWTSFSHIDQAIFSANALKKTAGSQILVFGVGDGVSGPSDNLAAVSGPVKWSAGGGNILEADYAQTNNWSLVAEQLKAAAAALTCNVPITIKKVEKPLAGGTNPGQGWKFTVTKTGDGTLTPNGQQTTPAGGSAAWNLQFTAPNQTAQIKVEEDPNSKPGWELESVVCTNNGTNIPNVPQTASFTLPGTYGVGSNIVCTVTNKQLKAAVKVDKKWIVNGVPYDDPNQLPSSLQAQLKLQNTGNGDLSNQNWSVARDGYTVGSTVKITEEQKGTWSSLCTWDSGVINGPGATDVNVKNAVFTTPALTSGVTTYTITNTVTCKSELTLIKVVHSNYGGGGQPSDWTLSYDGPSSGDIPSGQTEQLTPGAYTISESGGPVGYTQTGLTCTTGETDGTVTLLPGASVSCTFTNSDSPTKLTLKKVVVGAPGVDPDNWTLTVKNGETEVFSGTDGINGNVPPNTALTLSEAPLDDDFTASAWECQTGTQPPFTLTDGQLPGLPLGSSTVCTITNTAKTFDPTFTKTTASWHANEDGTWTIVYDVVVKNNNKFAAITYDLSDTLAFGGGITPSATASGPDGPIAGWDGVGNTALATGETLGALGTHTYTITAIATLAPDIDPDELECPGSQGDGGFLNRAALKVDGKAYLAQACGEPMLPTIDKAADGTPVDNGDGTWTLKYTLTVQHPGGADAPELFYDLTDTPALPAGVTIQSATVDGEPIVDGVIADGASLAGGAMKVYHLTYVITIASSVPASDLICTAGKGLTNTAALVSSNQTSTDSACQTVTLPSITHTKTVQSSTQGEDGNWTVVYKVTVTNSGDGTGVYSLTDDAKVPVDGVLAVVGTPSATGPSPQAEHWDNDNKVLATDIALPAGQQHEYVITIVVKVEPGKMGDPAARCAAQGGSNGFLNTATLTVGGTPADKSACASPALPTVEKTAVGTPEDNGDGTWTLHWEIKVKNTSGQDLYYTLGDVPAFPSGVDVTSTVVDPELPGTPVQIDSGDTHTYSVAQEITIPASVPPAALECEDENGLINRAVMVSGNQTVEDEDCQAVDPPVITHDKSVVSATQNPDGTWTVVYEIVVRNDGTVTGYYSLSDTPDIDVTDVLTFISASATDPNGDPVDGWNGVDGTLLASDRLLTTGSTETWTVTVDAAVAAGMVDDDRARCYEDGGSHGFINDSLLTVAGQETPDSACASPSKPVVTKYFVSAISTGAGTWEVTYTITVDNTADGAKTNYYTVEDTLGFPPEVAVEDYPVVTDQDGTDFPWNGGAFVPDPRELPAGEQHVYTVVVQASVPAGAEGLECTEEPGNGFYNAVLVAVGADELSDEDCGDITESVVPTIAKSVVAGYPQQQANGTWLIRYDVTVTNDAELPALYTLDDVLDFGEGIGIESAVIAASPSGVDTNPDWDGTPGNALIAADVTIDAATEEGPTRHVYTIEVVASVSAADYEERTTVCLPGAPNADKGGFLNTATLTSGKADPRTAQACAEPKLPTFEKVVDPGTPIAYANGAWTITYLLTVTNASGLQLAYDLHDTLGFAQGVTVSGQGVTTTAPGVTPNPLWTGAGGPETTMIVDDQIINAGTMHVFKVVATAKPGDGFDLDDAECTDEPGHGLFNGALLTTGGVEIPSEDCADLPVAELTLVKVVDNSLFPEDLDGHTLATIQDWNLGASNGQGGSTISGISGTPDVTKVLVPIGQWSLSEAPVADPGSDLMEFYTASEWDCLAAEAKFIVLGPGDAVTCTITNTGHPVDLKIVKSDGGAVIDAGEKFQYTFTVTNQGDIAAPGTVVTDEIPGTLAVQLSSLIMPMGWEVHLTGTDVNGFGGTLTFEKISPFPAGATAEFSFDVLSAVDLPREPAGTGRILDIVNTATVTSDGVEDTPGDNTSTEVTPVKSLEIGITGTCTLNAPYATWSITPWNTDPTAPVSLIWWTPESYEQRDPSIPADDVQAILADGALQVDVLPAPGAGWVSGTLVEGTQLWAGASIDPVTKEGTGWPGYALVDGKWVLDPSSPYYPIRDSAVIEVRMNPSTASTVGYPPAILGCRPPAPPLPVTGIVGGVGAYLLASGLFLLIGALVVAVSKNRRIGRNLA